MASSVEATVVPDTSQGSSAVEATVVPDTSQGSPAVEATDVPDDASQDTTGSSPMEAAVAPDRSGLVVQGTMGWSDAGAPWARARSAREKLALYARSFGCVEVDTSTYAIPDPAVVGAWAAATPPGFVFHFKLFGWLATDGGPFGKRARELP